MIRHRTIAVAAATALLGGLGAYGAATAFAATSDTTPEPTPSATSSPSAGGKSTEAMIQRCLKDMPANERGAAEKQMRKMTSEHSMMDGGSGMSMNGMMGSGSGTSMNGMMGSGSGESMSGMMGGAEGGS
ncbi:MULTISPECIES: hypothetical protein [Streptomyces]|uniref:Secreted protein n=1 Tax=Streptomyces zinciresistens K42 TaxID=700597 RepID=G2G5T9_9ACTN|nr:MULTISPECIES: hypothetical protein [Streptomyces]EGX61028.1 hypothetical protein SZN_04216 [Streptomyces zinciresistens K42]MDT9696555.1 hypothetical protein [Streptomyces sp. P17]